MRHGRKTVRLNPRMERLEERIGPSGAGATFTAILTPSGVEVPSSGTPAKPIAAVPVASDPARGKITLTVGGHGQELWVAGSLSHISNVSAVTLHDLKYPGSTPNYPGVIGGTVAVLLAPGNASGPRTKATFRTVVKEAYLSGPLVGRPLASLIADIKAGDVYALVQTNSGIDPSSAPSGPGNYPFGEIRGPVST
jgi:hypothetical protein